MWNRSRLKKIFHLLACPQDQRMRKRPTSLHQKNSFPFTHPALAQYRVVSIALLQILSHLVTLELVFHVAALEVPTLPDPPLKRDVALHDME
jgi:hypothetical protein